LDYENEWYKTEDLDQHHTRDLYQNSQFLYGHDYFTIDQGMRVIKILESDWSGAKRLKNNNVNSNRETVGRHCMPDDWVTLQFKTYKLDGTKVEDSKLLNGGRP